MVAVLKYLGVLHDEERMVMLCFVYPPEQGKDQWVVAIAPEIEAL